MKLLLFSLAIVGCALAYPGRTTHHPIIPGVCVHCVAVHQCYEIKCHGKREASEQGSRTGGFSCSCNTGQGCEKCYASTGVCSQVDSCPKPNMPAMPGMEFPPCFPHCKREAGVEKRDIPDFPDIPPIPPMPEMPPMPDFKREAGIEKRQTHVETCNCNFSGGVGGCKKCVNGNCFQVSSCNGKREAAQNTAESCNTWDSNLKQMVSGPCKREAGSEEISVYSCNCANQYPRTKCTRCINYHCSQVPSCDSKEHGDGIKKRDIPDFPDIPPIPPMPEMPPMPPMPDFKREAGIEKRQICSCSQANSAAGCKECDFSGNCRPVPSCNGKREAGFETTASSDEYYQTDN